MWIVLFALGTALTALASDSLQETSERGSAHRQQSFGRECENSECKTLMKTLGRGIQDKETGRIIQFVCMDQNSLGSDHCDRAAFLEIKNTRSLDISRISSDYTVSEKDDRRVLRKKLKRAVRKEHRRDKNDLVGFYTIAGAAAVAGTIMVVLDHQDPDNVSDNAGNVLAGGVFVAIALAANFGFELFDFVHGNPLVRYSTSASTFDEQNGWNWAENPKRVSSKRYDLIKSAIWRLGHEIKP